MPQEIKGYVRPPQMPAHLSERGDAIDRVQVPLLIRLFTWLLFLRCGINLLFAFLVGLAPDSDVAKYVALHFDVVPPPMPPEAVFFISALLYGVAAWRWYSRDWRVRWAVMFLSGATAIKTLVNLAADHATGNPTPLTDSQQLALTLSVAFNLIVCGYLAFYPGMAQAFKETPWD
jgi:hypothetical protein